MPVIINTRSGTVREVVGQAIIRRADGVETPLLPGAPVRAGDVILTRQDSIVEIVEDPVAPPVVAMPSTEIAQTIAAIETGRPETAPAATLTGGDGGSLQPGLRVDRIVETLSPLGLGANDGGDGDFTLAGDTRVRAPEDGLSIEPPLPTIEITTPPLTNDNTPTLTGSTDAPPGSLVTIEITDSTGNRQTVTVPVDENGRFTVDVPQPLADGSYSVTAEVTTPGGSSATDGTVGAIDTTPPAPTIALDAIAGNDVLDATEAGGNVTVSGSTGGDARPGDTVTVRIGDQTFVTTVQPDGRFSVSVPGGTLAGAAAGGVSASITSQDDAGNSASAGASRPYSVDQAPVAVDDRATVDEDSSAARGDLTPGSVGQDRDPEGGALNVSAVAAGSTAPATGGVGASVPGTWGTLVVQADGSYTYTPGAAANALRDGETATDTFAYRITDAEGNTATALLTVTVSGAADAAQLGGSLSGNVSEDGTLVAGGTVTIVDPDRGEATLRPQTGTPGTYGSFSIDAEGRWTYTLDNASPAVQGLTAGQQVTEVFTVTSADGTTTEVRVVVTGRDDGVSVTPGTGAVVEDRSPTTGGTLVATDPDNPALAFVPSNQNGAYGEMRLGADGSWTYTLGDAAQVLTGGQVVTETFTVALNDGTTTTITVTVTGTTDGPVISAGRGAVTEDSAPSTSGTLTATDADNPALAFVAGTQDGAFGRLGVDARGAWTYTLGPAAQALGAGDTRTEIFSVTLSDGSVTTVTIVVTGTDDAPVISAGTGAAVEDSTPVVGGRLSATDADNPALAFVPDTQAGRYGGLSLTADGTWTYTLGPAAQALAGGQVVTETFTVRLTDGSTTTVTITVTGTDDVPVISAGSAALIEDTATSVGGTLTARDADNPGLAFVPGSQAGAFGGLTVGADGQWTYTPGPGAQGLAGGQVVTETFTVTLTDGSTTTVTITITGTDDAPVISTGSGAVAEDTSPATSGTLTASDADNPALAFVPAVQNGAYGALTLAANGQWTYTLGPAAQALAGGQVATETFTVTLNDGSTTTVTITVSGTDDVPVISAGIGAVTEDTSPSTSGTLSATDADNAALAFVPATQAGAYGALTLAANGQWTYALGSAAQALAGGQVVTETFTVTLNDGSTTTVTITVTGTDDAPVISSGAGAVTEDTSPATSGTLSASDADNPALAFVPATQTGAYGALTLAANGQWTYTLGTAAQALSGGQVATESFTVTLNDGSTTTVTITVTGTDDAPVISSGTGAVTEDTSPTTSGTLTAADADNPALAFVPATQAGAYGALTLAADGQWTYTLGAAAQSLASGQVVTETFTATLNDGSTTTVTITVTGTNDAPVISSGTGAVTEDTAPTTSGTLTATDADNPALAFVPATQAGAYGSLTLAASGQWTYALGATAQALAGGQVVTETFTVTLSDGSTTTVTITVTGTDDAPVISAGAGAVTEDTSPTTSGTLTATDADNPALAFVPASQAGAYGALTLASTGQWTYTLGAAAQALGSGQVVTETFTVTLTDGSTTTVTITVTGTNDTSVVSTGTGAVTEDTAPTAGGTLTASDADNPALAFVPATQAGAYGALTLAASGQWTYSLGAAAQALGGGQVVTETFTVTLTDGSSTTVTITVTGTDDAPVVSSGTGAVTEDTVPVTSGTLTATDADNPALAFVPATQTGAFGALTLSANGQWTYALGVAAQALAGGQVVTETFTVTLTDGSSTTVTITVTGTDDAPVISSGAGAVTEDTSPTTSGTLSATDADNAALAFVPATQAGAYGALTLAANGQWTYSLGAAAQALAGGQVVTETFTVTLTDGSTTTVTITVTGTDDAPVISSGTGAVTEDTSPTTSGTLTATDADNPALAFVPAVQAGAYGALTLAASGQWTYALGAAAQALAGGQVVTETFTVTLTDGSTTTVTITVTGTDDAPVISTGSGAVTEDTSPATSGTLTASDADNPALAFVPAVQNGAYGALTLAANGQWTYSLGAAAQALAGGQVVTETFTVALNDGSTTTVTITVTGTNDAPVISSGTGAVTEDTAPTTSGTLTATDADNPALAFVPATQTGAYGALTLSANGQWTYALGGAAQALTGGQVVTETFTVTLNDGSTTTITITVTGTDDAPVISAGTGAVTEDTSPTTGGTLTATDADNASLAFVPASQAGAYGALTLAANGQWTYALGTAAQALAGGQVVTETFTVSLTDGSTTTVTITVTGTDDAPVISTGTGAVTEDTAPTTSGTLTASDADNPALAFVPATQAGAYGALTLAANGQWTYSLGAAAQALAGGQVVTETFTVALNDGSTTTVTITVTGTNDAPVISSGTGAVTEDTSPTTSGTLTATDADNPALAFVPATQAGAYGSLTLAANGQWTYSLGAAAQALAGGQVVTETFTVTLNDGSTTTVTITVTGTNDAPVISSGTGAVTEDTSPTTSGTLTATDPDNPALAFVPATQSGAYGALQLAANGQWTYTLGTAAQALAGGQVVTETFTVTLTDGSTTSVTITVTGTNDAPVISSGTGAVTEDSSPTTSGTLTATDADNPALAFVPATQAGAYGALTLTANGQWSYSLGTAAQALAGGQVVTETFTVTLNDGSTTTVTITVTGTDDAPVISSGTGAVTEDTSPTTSGTLIATDVDNPALAFVPATQTGAYGALTLSANGQWTYALGAAAQALGGGQVVTETFTVTLNDGSTTTVTITVTGTNDVPVISTGAGAVVEDLAPSTGGTLTATDADNPALAFVPTTQAGAFGALALAANGQWTYTLGAAAQPLAGGQTARETFVVSLTDGSTTTVTVGITGTNDRPVLDLDADNSSGATGADHLGSFVAGAGPVRIVDTDVTIADIDGGIYTGATVTLTNAKAGDVLTVGGLPAGITASVSGATVTLSGTASAADYALALGAIRFDNALGTPDLAARSFNVTVSDGTDSSNVAVSTLTIVPDTNDAPVNAVPGAVAVFEDRLTPIAGVSVADPDNGSAIPGFQISSVQLSVSNGTLQLTLASGASVVGGALGSGSITLSGSQAAINATLASLAYQGGANYVGGDTLVVITRDGQGLTDSDTVAITVAPVNDAPSGTDRTITLAEDGAHVFARADFGFTDAPGEGNNFASVTVQAPSNGTLTLNGVAVTAATVVTVAQLDAGQLRFVPAADASGTGYAGFDFRVRDDGGTANGGQDTDPTANRITLNVTAVNDAPLVGNAVATVSEEGLSGGVKDATGTPDITDSATASGRISITDIDSSAFTVTLNAPTAAVTSGGVAVTWSGQGTQTLVGTAGGRTVATISIDNGGNYNVTLSAPIDHAGVNVEDVRSLQFGVTASDGQASRTGTLTVNVEDDAPVVTPPTSAATLAMIDTNLMIVLDVSGSMNTADGIDGQTRLETAVAAVNRLLDQYDSFGGVQVRLVTFSSGASAVGTSWTSVADAKAQLAALVAGGATNYDAALSSAQSSWTSAGKLDGAQNTVYFFSDGQPSSNAAAINATEEAAWINFLNANQIRSYAVGLGVDAAQGPLNPVAYDGQTGENLNGLLVDDFAQLDSVLAATVPAIVTNPLLAGGTFDLPTSGIGADGGRVLSLQFGSTVYTYDPTGDGAIAVSGGPNQGSFDTTTNTLTVTTAAGGRYTVDLDNGRYSYTGPERVSAPLTDTMGFTIVDRDGDTTSSSVSVEVDRIGVQLGTAAGETINGTNGPDFIIARGGDDTVNGGDNNDRLAGNDGNDILRGQGGNDTLFGGNGADTLDGGDGADRLDGGVGNDRLTGGAGADVFAWTLADRGSAGNNRAVDTVADFNAAAPSAGGDTLDLRDLLVGETTATLDRFLDFSVSGGTTTLRISTTGGFAGGTYNANAEDQRIVFEGVDIRASLGLAGNASDATIIQTLLDRNKLIVDTGA